MKTQLIADQARPSAHAHHLVKKTAEDMAYELYEIMMGDNTWYAAWKKANPGVAPKMLEKLFVRKNIGLLLPQARAVLAAMLRTPIDESLKETIMEALTLDATLLRGRGH